MKRYAADLAGARVTLGGVDVTDSIEWVDVAGGRALVKDKDTGLAQFMAGPFLIESEAKKRNRSQQKEETDHEAQSGGVVRSRRRSTRKRS